MVNPKIGQVPSCFHQVRYFGQGFAIATVLNMMLGGLYAIGGSPWHFNLVGDYKQESA